MVKSKDYSNALSYYRLLQSGELRRYAGQLISFVDGELVGNDHDKSTLVSRVGKMHSDVQESEIQMVRVPPVDGKPEGVIELRL
tara:strand:+ start:230 stop:481 length:252 start_codon:yes stop_codon:yes gene_type:complete